MRRCLVAVFVICLFVVLPKVSWSDEQGVEGFHLLCDPCEALCKKTLDTIGTRGGLTCLGLGGVFGSVCEAAAGGNPAGAALCVTGGVAVSGVCEDYYSGSPQMLVKDAGEASKLTCKKIKLCK